MTVQLWLMILHRYIGQFLGLLKTIGWYIIIEVHEILKFSDRDLSYLLIHNYLFQPQLSVKVKQNGLDIKIPKYI